MHNKVSHAFASSEVILSAGAIGAAQELSKHKIDMHMHLPGVGKNLQDHLNVSVLAHTKEAISLCGINKGWSAITTGLRYFCNKSGPGVFNAAESGAFVSSKFSPQRPDIQLHFIPLMVFPKPVPEINVHGVSIHACHLRPTAVGEVTTSR